MPSIQSIDWAKTSSYYAHRTHIFQFHEIYFTHRFSSILCRHRVCVSHFAWIIIDNFTENQLNWLARGLVFERVRNCKTSVNLIDYNGIIESITLIDHLQALRPQRRRYMKQCNDAKPQQWKWKFGNGKRVQFRRKELFSIQFGRFGLKGNIEWENKLKKRKK